MKTKQIIALVVAAVLFVFVGASNVLVQIEAEKERVTNDALTQETEEYLNQMFGITSDGTIDYEAEMPTEDFVAVISVTDTIQAGYSSSNYNGGYFHEETLAYIDALMDSNTNQAILLYEETPGGTIIDSDELYLKLMQYKEVTGRPVYSYMHSYAYSGGYYIAMAADKIIANRNATTGSIGVIMSTYDLTGLYEKLGIKSINITSGANKAMFTGDDAQTQEQIKIYQEIVDEAFGQFLGIVEKGRGMTEAQLKPYADGRVFSAQKAQELGLIDEVVNTYEDALNMVAEELEDENILFENMPLNEMNFWSSFFLKAEELVPKSDNQVLEDLTNLDSKGLMYYAEP